MNKLLFRTALSLACISSLAVNAQGANTAPIMLAVSAGQADKVSDLLSKGANPDTRDVNGQTALDLATEHQHVDLIALMREAS